MKNFVFYLLLIFFISRVYADLEPGPETTASPQDEITLTYVGSTLWRDMFDVAIDSNYAYCAMRWGLMILDVSAPDSPFFVSQVYMPHGIAKRVVVAGSYAYVVHDSSDLQIVDISSPSDPVLAGSYKTPGNALDVGWQGTTRTWRILPLVCRLWTFPTPLSPPWLQATTRRGWLTL